ncbi:hypothetical protein C8R46DRAFT_1077752 [Mycena filopes]|nr:hypothetical protein C8R46DRAFT_1077752 [Mycena filopes]
MPRRSAGANHEAYWFQRYLFLENAGYRLRPKFRPGFTINLEELTDLEFMEYRAHHPRFTVMDAQRISDGKDITLKAISTKLHPDEVDIALLFSAPPYAGDPRNHCIPVLQVLQDPEIVDKRIIVMQRMQIWTRPTFETVGEVIDCFRQLFEGIEFMHENFVAHRNCSVVNFVQDPVKLFPKGFHPVHTAYSPDYADYAYHLTRTQCWPRYYIIDFGLSRRYNPANGPPLEDVILGGDKTPPEHLQTACNPFPTDIYFLGNLLKQEFVYSLNRYEDPRTIRRIHPPLRFLQPLIDDMTLEDPASRPAIGEVIQRFDALCSGLSRGHLRRAGRAFYWSTAIGRWWRQIKNTVKRVPPLPPYTPCARTPLTDEMRVFYTQTPLTSGGNPTDPRSS